MPRGIDRVLLRDTIGGIKPEGRSDMMARMSGVAMTMASILVLVSAERGHARCDPSGADAADVAIARAAVAANCDCDK